MFKLSHKGLFIVLLPVAFEAAFLWHVQSLLHDIDLQIENETRSSQTLLAIQSFMADTADAMAAAVNYRCFGDEKYFEQHEQVMRNMVAHGKELWSLVQTDPEARAQVHDWIHGQSMQTRVRRQLMRDQSEPNPRVSDLFGGAMVTKRFAEIVNRNRTNAASQHGPIVYEKMMNVRKSAADAEAQQNLSRTEKTLKEWLLGGALMSCLLTAGTAIIFHRGVYSRLQQILSNIDRLIRRAPLEPPRPGSDEIAELDRAINETAASISQLEKFRADAAQNMATQLNEPLGRIADGIRKLKASGFEDLTERAENRLSIAYEQVERLQLLLQDLISLDKMTEARLQLSMSRCNLRDITNGARAAVANLAEKRNIELKFNVADLPVRCDKARLAQVVINLLSNAIKFSPNDSEIEVEGSREGNFACITVLDRGRGIDPSFQSKIFHRFEQAKEEDQNKGSGLGLAICRDLVEAHGGLMTFESQPGRTQFRVRFPIESTEITRDARAPRTVAQYDGRLWRKGLVLLALPLAIQLSVVGSLAFIVDRAAHQIDSARNALYEAFYFNDASVRMFFAYTNALLFNATQEGLLRKQFDEALPVIQADLQLLQQRSQLYKSDASAARIANLSAFINTSIGNATAIMNAEPDVHLKQWLSKTNATAQLAEGLDKVMTDVRKAIVERQQQETNQLAMNGESRRLILNIMRFGLLVSVLASVLVATAFTRNLCARIGRIVQNSRRLLRGEPLIEPAGGSVDEISTVDAEFYAAARHLRELDRFRQELLSVTSHELRTPLTALLGNFDILSTGMYGAPTGQGAAQLAETRNECAQLVQSITRFLDEEKARAFTKLTQNVPDSLTTSA